MLKKYCCFQKIFLKTGPKYLLRGGKESNTFPGSDWAGDGSLQYRPNIHIRNENQGTNTYTSTERSKYKYKYNESVQYQENILVPRDGAEIGEEDHHRNIENNSEKIDLIVPFHLSFVTYFMSMSTSATIWNDMVKSTI